MVRSHRSLVGQPPSEVPAYVRGVRQGGLFFVLMGLSGLIPFFIPGSLGYHRAALLAVVASVLLPGVLAQNRIAYLLTGYRSLLLPTLGLTAIAVCNGIGLLNPSPLGICFIVIFLWIGQWHPPGTAIRYAPLAAVAYLLPYGVGAPNGSGQVASAFVVLGASIMVAEVVARQTASAHRARVKQAEAMEALSLANRTDDLTGLGNRRLGNQLLECLSEGDALIVLDVDQFKAINDTHGHVRGDELLHELGMFLRRAARHPESVARMGGEEFMLVIKNVSTDTALVVAQRLVRGWRHTSPLATISAGVAAHQAGESPSATYAKADAALYRAKDLGRDRVVLASL